jgi:hypothetical protein
VDKRSHRSYGVQAQAKAGLLQVSEDKHTKEVKVQHCVRTCSKYTDFRPYKESTLEAPAPAVVVPGVKGTTLSGANRELQMAREISQASCTCRLLCCLDE